MQRNGLHKQRSVCGMGTSMIARMALWSPHALRLDANKIARGPGGGFRHYIVELCDRWGPRDTLSFLSKGGRTGGATQKSRDLGAGPVRATMKNPAKFQK
jgi:hypothetical protein